MAEHHLHRPNIHSVFQTVGCATMAEHVRADSAADLLETFVDNLPDPLARKMPRLPTRSLTPTWKKARRKFSPFLKVFFNGVCGLTSDRSDALFIAFAAHEDVSVD